MRVLHYKYTHIIITFRTVQHNIVNIIIDVPTHIIECYYTHYVYIKYYYNIRKIIIIILYTIYNLQDIIKINIYYLFIAKY